MKLEVSEEFVKESYESACQTWKERIKKEFHSLFDVKPIIGKWYFMNVGGNVSKVNIQGYGNGTSYGVDWLGNWQDGCYFGINQPWSDYKEMPPQEIEAMLWKEAEKRGFKEGVKYISLCTDKENTIKNGLFLYENNGDFSLIDTSSHSGNFIFHEGKWAEIVDPNKEIKEQISRLEKELKELKEKVK